MSAAAPKSERGSMQDLSTGMQQVNNDDDDSLDAEARRAEEEKWQQCQTTLLFRRSQACKREVMTKTN
jgi:hypothetical protein